MNNLLKEFWECQEKLSELSTKGNKLYTKILERSLLCSCSPVNNLCPTCARLQKETKCFKRGDLFIGIQDIRIGTVAHYISGPTGGCAYTLGIYSAGTVEQEYTIGGDDYICNCDSWWRPMTEEETRFYTALVNSGMLNVKEYNKGAKHVLDTWMNFWIQAHYKLTSNHNKDICLLCKLMGLNFKTLLEFVDEIITEQEKEKNKEK